MGAPLRLATALAAVLLAVSACGDDGPTEGPLGSGSGSGSGPGTSASSPTASPTATPPAVPAATDDEKGRQAFARWFVQALAYAQGSNDASPITAVAADGQGATCHTCSDFETFLADRKAKGIRSSDSEFTVKRVIGSGTSESGVRVYSVVTSYPATQDVREDGTVVKKYPADENYLIQIGLRLQGGAYQLTGWKTGGGSEK